MAVCYAMATSVAAAAQDHLTIALFNLAGVPDEVMDRAVKIARLAFADAGIRAEWTKCITGQGTRNGCVAPIPPPGHYVVVNVVPTMVVPPPGTPPDGDLAGYAHSGLDALRAPRAYAFYDKVLAFARKSHRKPALILGCVLMHEVAHSLGLPHRAHGVMQAALHPQDLDDASQGLAFSRAEARQLRGAVIRLNTEEPKAASVY
jgi:hypothetical protein